MDLSQGTKPLPQTTLFFFENFVGVWGPVMKSWFDVPATPM